VSLQGIRRGTLHDGKSPNDEAEQRGEYAFARARNLESKGENTSHVVREMNESGYRRCSTPAGVNVFSPLLLQEEAVSQAVETALGMGYR
jgi:hypothetical protein